MAEQRERQRQEEVLFEFSTLDARAKFRHEMRRLRQLIEREGAKRIIVNRAGETVLDVSVADALAGTVGLFVNPIIAAARQTAKAVNKAAQSDFTIRVVRREKESEKAA